MNLNYKIPNVISLKELRNQSPMKYGKLIKQLMKNRVNNTKHKNTK
jgi:hypothetical protein